MNATNVPTPLAWRLPAADAARFAEAGKHCEARPCLEPITIVTWRKFWSNAVGCELLAERFVATRTPPGSPHAARFAARYRITIEDAPDEGGQP